MTLVVEASVVAAACLAQDGWSPFDGQDLVAPPLAVSEAGSVLHEARWRGELEDDDARGTADRLATSPVLFQSLEGPRQAWAIADELGWAKTYDAEYVALARRLDCKLVTLDERLCRGIRSVVEVISPADL
jgi:predicted nucleic acid-binding protein